MRTALIKWKWTVIVLFGGLMALSGAVYFSTRSAAPLAGQWTIVHVWSENDYLARLNIREGVNISIEPSGFLKAGRLGLDGVVGRGWCGWNCGKFTANGFNQAYRITLGGKSNSKLLFTNDSPAAVIVAERAD